MKTPAHYDERHSYCRITPERVTWAGDPARGEFNLKDKKQKGKRKPR